MKRTPTTRTARRSSPDSALEVPPEAAVAAYWSRSPEALWAALDSSPAGLSSSAAKQRLRTYGPNTLDAGHSAGALRLLLSQFESPLVLILIFAAGISLVAREWSDAVVVLFIVLGSALLGFSQEYRATTAVAQLRSRVTVRANVLRDGKSRPVPAAEIVPGDVVLLAAGSLIPADGVVLQATDCFVSQAVLTGETFPVEKRPGASKADAGLAERTNALFMGTSVRSGTATMLIAVTGTGTAFGAIAQHLTLRPPETDFERGIRQFGYMLTRVMVVLVLAVFVVNIHFHKPVIDSLLFAIALAVGLAPELLPAIMSITLAKGAQDMARRGVIVRHLNAIENFGSMDVLCTDKTGTLTEGVVHLEGALDALGEPSKDVAGLAYLNASLQSGLPNPLDEAITASVKPGDAVDEVDGVPGGAIGGRIEGVPAGAIGDVPSGGIDGVSSNVPGGVVGGVPGDLPPGVTKLDEIPYDFVRKRLSIVVQGAVDAPPGPGVPLLITKGALDNVLAVCDSMRDGPSSTPLDAGRREAIRARLDEWGGEGIRVLGVATRRLPPLEPGSRYGRDVEGGLEFRGFLKFFDPPKPEVARTVADLGDLGVTLKIISGDNRYVTRHVADAVGLKVAGELTGPELAGLSDEALWHVADHTTLFSEVDPNQKERIIRALMRGGHVVGYLGDGINDAPALQSADVGISVDQAVDVAKEAADFVLLDRDLDVLRRGIVQGRRTFANTLKYVFTTTSANFGNMFSMAAASWFLPFLPLLAKQILLNNFLSDFPAMAIAGDNVDPEWIRRPRRWDIRFIQRFMITFGLISSAFDFLTFGLLFIVVRAAPAEFRTGWFVESLLTELAIALIVRTSRPAFRSRPGSLLLWLTVAVAIVAIALPYSPLAGWLGFVPLPWPVMAAVLVLTWVYATVSEVAKLHFFKTWGFAPKHGSTGRV